MEFREQGAGKDDLPAGIRFNTAHDVGAGRRKESVVTKSSLPRGHSRPLGVDRLAQQGRAGC